MFQPLCYIVFWRVLYGLKLKKVIGLSPPEIGSSVIFGMMEHSYIYIYYFTFSYFTNTTSYKPSDYCSLYKCIKTKEMS